MITLLESGNRFCVIRMDIPRFTHYVEFHKELDHVLVSKYCFWKRSVKSCFRSLDTVSGRVMSNHVLVSRDCFWKRVRCRIMSLDSPYCFWKKVRCRIKLLVSRYHFWNRSVDSCCWFPDYVSRRELSVRSCVQTLDTISGRKLGVESCFWSLDAVSGRKTGSRSCF